MCHWRAVGERYGWRGELLGLHRLETFKVVVLRNIALPLSPPTALSSIFALVIVQTDALQNGKWALSLFGSKNKECCHLVPELWILMWWENKSFFLNVSPLCAAWWPQFFLLGRAATGGATAVFFFFNLFVTVQCWNGAFKNVTRGILLSERPHRWKPSSNMDSQISRVALESTCWHLSPEWLQSFLCFTAQGTTVNPWQRE